MRNRSNIVIMLLLCVFGLIGGLKNAACEEHDIATAASNFPVQQFISNTEVNPFTGDLNINYPLFRLPGPIPELDLNIALNYNSNYEKWSRYLTDDSVSVYPFGAVGWSISPTSNISIFFPNGFGNYGAELYISLLGSVSGRLYQGSPNQYWNDNGDTVLYKIAKWPQIKVMRIGSSLYDDCHWEVITQSGVKYIFGEDSTASRRYRNTIRYFGAIPQQADYISQWDLERIEWQNEAVTFFEYEYQKYYVNYAIDYGDENGKTSFTGNGRLTSIVSPVQGGVTFYYTDDTYRKAVPMIGAKDKDNNILSEPASYIEINNPPDSLWLTDFSLERQYVITCEGPFYEGSYIAYAGVDPRGNYSLDFFSAPGIGQTCEYHVPESGTLNKIQFVLCVPRWLQYQSQTDMPLYVPSSTTKVTVRYVGEINYLDKIIGASYAQQTSWLHKEFILKYIENSNYTYRDYLSKIVEQGIYSNPKSANKYPLEKLNDPEPSDSIYTEFMYDSSTDLLFSITWPTLGQTYFEFEPRTYDYCNGVADSGTYLYRVKAKYDQNYHYALESGYNMSDCFVDTTRYTYYGGKYTYKVDESRHRFDQHVIYSKAIIDKPIPYGADTLYFHNTDMLGGLIYKKIITDSLGTIFQEDSTSWQYDSQKGRLKIYEQTENDFGQVTATEYEYDEPFGNQTHIHYFGDINDSNDDRNVYYTYLHNQDSRSSTYIQNNITNKIWSECIKSSPTAAPFDSVISRYDRDDIHDQPSNPLAPLGNKTFQKTWNAGGNDPFIKFGYGYVAGLVTQSKDSYGNLDSISYNGYFPKNEISPIGWSYYSDRKMNPFGELMEQKDPNGIVTRNLYDKLSRLSYAVVDGDTLNEFIYSNALDLVGSYGHPELYSVISYKFSTSTDTSLETRFYDGMGNLIQIQTPDPNNDYGRPIVIDYTYDSFDRVKSQSNPYTYPLFSFTDYHIFLGPEREQPTTYFFYDELGRLTKTINPDSSEIINAYSGRTKVTTDEIGQKTKFVYDAYGNLIEQYENYDSQNDTYLDTTIFTYNLRGQLETVRDPEGLMTTYTYNSLGQVEEKTTPDAGRKEILYDLNGNPRFSKDGNLREDGEFSYQKYDALNRLVSEGIYSDSTQFTQTNANSQSWPSNEPGLINVNAYDQAPDPEVYPWSVYDVTTYLDSLSYSTGRLTANAFRTGGYGLVDNDTLLNRLINSKQDFSARYHLVAQNGFEITSTGDVTMRAGESVILRPGFHADLNSHFNASIDTALLNAPVVTEGWQINLFSYDEKGRVIRKYLFSEDLPLIRYVYLYNLQNQVTRALVSVGQEAFYHFYDYNQLGQLAKVYVSQDSTCPNLSDVFYTYNAGGLVDTLRLHEISADNFQLSVPYSYDERLRLTDIGDVLNDLLLFSARYSYLANGNVDTAVFNNKKFAPASRYRFNYGYDPANRLTSADFYRYSGGWQSVSSYDVSDLAYDKNGNINLLTRKDETGSNIDQLSYGYYPGTNRLQSVTDMVNPTAGIGWDVEDSEFEYDANGNMIAVVENGVPAIYSIEYDYRNLPTSLVNRNGSTVQYRYDVNGNRIFKKVGSQEAEFYIMDGSRNMAVISGTGGLKYWNIFGNDLAGKILASGEKDYYIKDHLGSIRAIVNDQGTTVEAHDYYPFGLEMPERSFISGEQNKELFTGKERDTETNWDYFGARYYDASIGRWLSVDPLAEKFAQWSSYNYALDNPMIFFDPTGMVVVFANEDILAQHKAFYDQRDEKGDYINTEYIKLYNELDNSDVVYEVVDADLGGADENEVMKLGNFTTDGTNVTIELDMTNGADVGHTLCHEFVHGTQFERGEFYFGRNPESEDWSTIGMTIDLEYEAFAGQQLKQSWWQAGNRDSNLQWVNKYYPSLVGKGPKHTDPWKTRLVLRTPTYFGISLPEK